MRAEALVGANLLMLLAGLGVLPLLRVAHSWRELAYRSGLAYLCGILLAGILSAHLALVHVGFGWAGLATLAVVSLAACCWRLRGSERPGWALPGWIHVVGVVAVAAVIADYARAFRVAPLNRYDAWAIWALKGHALYAFGWADPTVFAGSAYRFANLDYPLLLPSLEAIAFRSMGAFDTRLIHLQFLCLLVAALAALFALLRDRVPAVVLWLSLFAIAVAPAVFDQLLTAYADLPLALVFCVGVAASGRWLLANERWALAVATFCFAGALLMKNEGSPIRSRGRSSGCWSSLTGAGARSRSPPPSTSCSCSPGGSTFTSTISATSTTASATPSTTAICTDAWALGGSRSARLAARCSMRSNGASSCRCSRCSSWRRSSPGAAPCPSSPSCGLGSPGSD